VPERGRNGSGDGSGSGPEDGGGGAAGDRASARGGGANGSGSTGGVESGSTSTALAKRGLGGEICFVRFSPKPPYNDRLVLWADPQSSGAASFRLLRQRLIERDNPRAILCTSAGPNEGKTTLASNLALAFAEIGRHSVLLVEADFQTNALTRLFGFAAMKGLKVQLARHKRNPEGPWVVIQVGSTPLYVLVAGTDGCAQCGAALPRDARFCPSCGAGEPSLALLDGTAFLAAMERFRQAFDYVIVDSPAVLTGGAVNLIQDAADAVVFATRKGRSSEHDLRRAIEQVAPAPLAAVLLFDR
jgi:Mrp family chromosome partitioning ATPase